MAWPDVHSAKRELVKAAQHLAKTGMLFRGEHANLSARVDGDRVVITEGGSVANLTEDRLAVVDLHGKVLEGEIDPVNAEIIAMHTAVYRSRESVGGIVHAHAPHATVFAVAHQEIPVAYEPLLRFGITEPVPVVAWAPRGSDASVRGIVDVAEHRPGQSAVLLANHGVLAFTADPMQSARLLATLDEAAELIIQARQIGGERLLPEQAFDQVRGRMAEFGSRTR